MEYTIKASKIYLENSILENSSLYIKDGIIAEIAPEYIKGTLIELEDLILMPGLIDIHVHGGGGYDVMDASYEAVNGISVYKLKEGVTSFIPTTVTASMEATQNAVKYVSEAFRKGTNGARIEGIFLEGPYISPAFKGAHPENQIKDILLEELFALADLADSQMLLSAAIAPEKENAVYAIKALSEKGINIRLGHSGASFNEAEKGFVNGANILIHTYNAMAKTTAREPGILGAAFDNKNVYTEIIADNIHVHPANIKVLYQVKGRDKVILITDCMRAGGLDDGKYNLGELDVFVKDGIARTHDGTLAGSTLKLNKAVINIMDILDIPLFDAAKMASEVPAKALGINYTGVIAKGMKADLIGCTNHMDIQFVMVDGEIKNV